MAATPKPTDEQKKNEDYNAVLMIDATHKTKKKNFFFAYHSSTNNLREETMMYRSYLGG